MNIQFKQEEKRWSVFPFTFYSFSFDDLLIYAFIWAHGNVTTYQITFELKKLKHLSVNKTEKHGRWKSNRALSLSHRATRGPLSSHHLKLLPLAMMHFCATQCERVWGGGEGPQRANPKGKSELSLSLCVIQYHACVPMSACQDIWVQSQGMSHGRVRL